MMIKEDGFKRVEDKAFYADMVRCSKCSRALKSSSKWIGDHQKVLCESCYKDIAFPFLNSSYGEAY